MNGNKVVYPAVFEAAAEGGYTVYFPDFPGCVTEGEDLYEAITMARDALGGVLVSLEDDGDPIPSPSDINDIAIDKPDISKAYPVDVDLIEMRKAYDSKAVKKTLTIPGWLNTIAEKHGVNYSQVLQDALKQKFNIEV